MPARIQIPSPNYSSGRASNRLLVIHTSEGATTFRSLGNFLASPSAGVSYQAGGDDTTSAEIGVYVRHYDKAWAAFDANNWGEHFCLCTPSGASAGWSRDTWLSKERMLDACAAWVAEEAARYGVPLTKLDGAAVAAGAAGICGHGDISAAGVPGGHTDPGGQFPWDVLLAKVGGAPPTSQPPPPSGSAVAPPLHVDYFGPAFGHNHLHADVQTWQARMLDRGWSITVDQVYGSQSEDVCRSFQAEKGLGVDGLVGPDTWGASWSAPVT